MAMTPSDEKVDVPSEVFDISQPEPKIDPKTGKKIVEIGLRFRVDQIASISTVDQTYHALCSLDMDWVATEEDIINQRKDAREYVPQKIPRIDPKNIVVKETNYKPWANGNLIKLVLKNGVYYNLRRIEYDCIWSEPFEVNYKYLFAFVCICFLSLFLLLVVFSAKIAFYFLFANIFFIFLGEKFSI